MVGVDDDATRARVPVTSLYGVSFDSLTPAAGDLDGIDLLIIDLQDVGSRYYTYVWTMRWRSARRRAPGLPCSCWIGRTRSAASPSKAALSTEGCESFSAGRGPRAARPDDRRDGTAGRRRMPWGRALRATAGLSI